MSSIDGEGERGKGRTQERTEGRGKERCGGVWFELEHAVAHWRELPKIEALCVFSSTTLLLSEKRARFLRGNFTVGHRAVRDRGSSPEMNREGSLRRRLSSLRGAWRWSTGYLFRKVGRK